MLLFENNYIDNYNINNDNYNDRWTRRPDLVLEKNEEEIMWLCHIACPQERNIEIKSREEIDIHSLKLEKRERIMKF